MQCIAVCGQSLELRVGWLISFLLDLETRFSAVLSGGTSPVERDDPQAAQGVTARASRSTDATGVRYGKEMGPRICTRVSRVRPSFFATATVRTEKDENDGICTNRFDGFAPMLAEKGYTAMEIDLCPPTKDVKRPAEFLEHFENGLSLSPHQSFRGVD